MTLAEIDVGLFYFLICVTFYVHKLSNKMTNKEDFEDPSRDARIAGLLAVHLVSQVLDEASIIVNAAKDSGQPWRYISSLKKMQSFRLDDTFEKDTSFLVSKGDSHYICENQNVVVTSTPQKSENKIEKSKNEVNLMGQGDEELEVRGNELRRSTSMFINHLIDMSDVEHDINNNEPDIMQNRNTRSEEFLTEAIGNTFEYKQTECNLQPNIDESLKTIEYSSYSFLSDANSIEISKERDISILDGESNENKIQENVKNDTVKEITWTLDETIQKMDKDDLALYENAYLTMNRDYEQYSEEEQSILPDPKAASLQDVQLVTSTTSVNNEMSRQALESNALTALSAVSTSGTRKSSIVRRCRNQGARLLSCLRGWWWRRKLLGKRKEPRVYGSIRGLCPLSPDARRRAASLLDQRNLRTPSPSKSVGWKFNTVNEALVRSSRWKDFGLKMRLNENDEF